MRTLNVNPFHMAQVFAALTHDVPSRVNQLPRSLYSQLPVHLLEYHASFKAVIENTAYSYN